ncbi:hypothetical protein NQ314_004811 [Rhamnusium bicolor]|uniref:FGGY carbohydrate kinase domain-containing protein n=1 Tax=Rhamnusium bicolor TaxID=1586634 RepID=A0AAV8ZI16_9CUCU|nr:hypothetical protein NQ314_004811 [Rhamnusium bicolor]
MDNTAYFIGVDVGTGSVRAALVSENGKIVSSAVEATKTWNIQKDFYEQSTDNIWNAVVNCIKRIWRKITGKKIGSVVLAPGSPVGCGLSKSAACALGLLAGTPVGVSMIDAHAGGLGLIGCRVDSVDPAFHTRLSLICGTSTCHMAVSKEATFTPGIWGPYKNAMVPGMWLNEGGQSATGKLIDHVIDSHPATPEIRNKLGDLHIQQYLSNILHGLAEKENLKSVAFLTKDIHVWPDFHGNRSPIADPSLKGAICGLTLAEDEESLALLYLATVQALSDIQSTLICGGLSKNPIFTEAQADVCNLPVVCPDEVESVLLGSAILGACAAKHFKDMTTAIQSMGGRGRVVEPQREVVDFHNKKYEVFLKMYEHQLEYRSIMNN